jgi:hypothetical protein
MLAAEGTKIIGTDSVKLGIDRSTDMTPSNSKGQKL